MKLKKCPFCGSKNIKIFKPYPPKDLGGRAVLCKDCNVRVGFPYALDDTMVSDLWNRRY